MSSRGERERRWIVVALASLLSCGVVAVGSTWVARSAGAAAGQALAGASDELSRDPDGLDDPDGEAGPTPSELAGLSGASPIEIPRGWIERVPIATPQRPHAPAVPRRPGAPAPAEAPVLGILVRASAVRAAIARGGRPSGSAVAASGERPAGLLLQGVSSYGTALRDGDLLTQIGGTPATSEGRVIAAVSGAVRSRARAIDGVIWRAGRRIPFVVELPRGRKRSR